MTTHADEPRITRDAFCQRLAGVLESNSEIAEAIERVAASASRRPRVELQRIAQFFARRPSPDEVLRHRDALSICLPLVSSDRSGPPSGEEIEASVHAWIYQTRHRRWQVHRRLVAFAYPLVVAALTLLIIVLICVFLVPVFEQMFLEFGLSLPAPTVLLIGTSHVVRDYGVALLLGGVIAAVALWIVERWRQRAGRSPWRVKLSQRFQSDRGALADWAGRTASLIQSGLPTHEAIAMAGAVSGKGWLQRWAETGADKVDQEIDAAEAPWPRVGRYPCRVFAYALRLPSAASQAALLRAAAVAEIDRDQRRSGWWISAFSVLSIFGVGFLIGLVVLALLMPLVSLITGLS